MSECHTSMSECHSSSASLQHMEPLGTGTGAGRPAAICHSLEQHAQQEGLDQQSAAAKDHEDVRLAGGGGAAGGLKARV